MLEKSIIQYLKSLQDKKTRYERSEYIIEWKKSILEAIAWGETILRWYFTKQFIETVSSDIFESIPYSIISDWELHKISSLRSNRDWILVMGMKKPKKFVFANTFVLVLDSINDPGNLGTIIRIADWYGITDIIASKHTVDLYNPKTIMATMGSLARVNVHYEDLEIFFENISSEIPVYGAYLEGKNIRNLHLPKPWYIVIGSEANGISENIKKYITEKITIPRFGKAESLNAWVATGIILDRLIK